MARPLVGLVPTRHSLGPVRPSSALRHNTYRMFSQSEQSVDLVQAKTNRPTDNKTRDRGTALSSSQDRRGAARIWAGELGQAWTLEPHGQV